METGMKLENMEVKSGEKVSGFLQLDEFRIPALIVKGKREGKTVLITAGVHAAEYVGIQAAVALGDQLNPELVAGTVIILKVVNRPAFEQRAGSMGLTDGKNLNWVFPGNPEGSEMERLAHLLVTRVYPQVDYYIDLHSGDFYEDLTPYVYYAGKAEETVVKTSRRMAEQVDVPYMVRSDVASGGAYNYAASMGIPGILIERGSMGSWSEEEANSTGRDVRNILCSLGIYQGKQDYRKYYPLDVENVRYQDASHHGLWYPTKKAGELFVREEVLGCVRDYEGEVIEIVRAEYDGVILYQTGSLQVLENGPMIAYGQIVKRFDDRKERIVKYWGKRSDSFLDQRRAELHSPLAGRWLAEIRPRLPEKKQLRILDVGCGAGFFTILLAKEGHQVTGTDLTPEMIDHAKILAAEEDVDCEFLVMDAEHLEFEDAMFDVVISRNLTWTLPDAAQAYTEWKRVLKPEGVILNFDANYGMSDFADTSHLPENHAHQTLGNQMMQECEDIKHQLPISSYSRPAWDLDTLGKMEFAEFQIDLGPSRRIYTEKDEFYNPTPLFMVRAVKGTLCDAIS